MPTARLHDGREVDTSSAEWRLETLARWVLELKPLDHRREWLAEFDKKHPQMAPELRERVRAIFQARKAGR